MGARWLSRSVFAVACAAPWLWLLAFVALSVGATLHLGRLPRYNNPDPKHIAHLAWLHSIASGLLVPTALSPLAVSAYLAIRSFVSSDIHDERWILLAYGLGYAIAAVVIFGNVLGLGDWFLD
jgi:hypothetical protein